MPSDIEILKKIKAVSSGAPDPKRAETNLVRFFETVAEKDKFLPYLQEAARLFAFSQFLANYCVYHPEEFYRALKEIKEPVSRKELSEKAAALVFNDSSDIAGTMTKLRLFKKPYLLKITLRDIMGETDILASMDELTCLAEVVIDIALACSIKMNAHKYGDPSDREFSLIALGKLGGEELNYSSDVDLMAVYAEGDGYTSGVQSPSGVRLNKITDSEFYAKVMELFNRLLSWNTEDGIAYRVDLRLRPQGGKGDIAMPLQSYRMYYETWGTTWERMALIRARPVAGSARLGRQFMEAIEPFIWKKTMDFSEIEEIRALKKKIDSAFSREDIKRGYGGIREAEFFFQTFQLIYGHEHKGLRTHRLLNAIQSFRWLRMIPEEDLVTLWDNYLYLRKTEHLLQMKDDLQTHSLPLTEEDLLSLSKKMGFPSVNNFLSELKVRRMKVRNMYNSLLGTEEDVHSEALTLLESDLGDNELFEYLSFRGIKKPAAGLMNLKKIREQFTALKTQRERTVMRSVIPLLIEGALKMESPDRALKGLESFFEVTVMRETYLTGLMERKELREGIIKLFSLSTYLTRNLLSSTRYLDLLLEGNVIRKSLKKMREELDRSIQYTAPETGASEYRNVEEIRLGSFFLMHVIKVDYLVRGLSHLAEAVIRMICEKYRTGAGFAVLGMGKLGGREITFGSDLDIIFLSDRPDDLKSVEKIIKALTAYTDKGILYNIDMRLRPDGTKGVLLNDVQGYRNYYAHSARPWELQSLLKVRLVAGDGDIAREFMDVARDAIIKRGKELKRPDMQDMRERIIKELSQESKGIDIKLGPGGIEEIEFYVQWLQLQHAGEHPEILVQDTTSAIRRLMKKSLLSQQAGSTLSEAYIYLRTLETFMRLNEEHVITEDSGFTELAAIFMGQKKRADFLEHLKGLRRGVAQTVQAAV